MPNTITIIPYSGNPAAPYTGAGTTKSFAAWGLADGFTRGGGGDGGQQPEIVQLLFPGTCDLSDIFPYRALIKIKRDGMPFFTGVIPKDSVHFKSGNRNAQIINVASPIWFLEHRVFLQEINVVTAVSATGVPTFQTIDLTHFTLNLPLATNIISSPPTYSVTYTPSLLDAAHQIAAILDFAKAAGDYLDYQLADLMAVPVEPADVLNITCADAIRRQLDMYDCVMWLDHTQDPPRLHVQRRSALTAVARTKGNGGTVQSFKLRERTDLKVPFVQVSFEQPYSLGNGISGTTTQTYVYPPPPGATEQVIDLGGGLQATVYQPTSPISDAPAVDSLNALITTIPLKGIAQNTTSKYIQTDYIDPDDITWWQRRRPEMDPTHNPNFATDYANLAIVPNSGTRNLDPNTYPNMITAGGWAPWMGGTFGYDHILAQISYKRKTTPNIPGRTVPNQTVHANAHCTSLNFPDGAWINFVTTSSTSTFFNALTTVPQLVYTDLSADQWEGTITVVEPTWRGDLTVGKVFNLLGYQERYAAMNALIQNVEMTVKTGVIVYTLTVGPNKSISPDLIKQRLLAARWRYVTALNVPGSLTNGFTIQFRGGPTVPAGTITMPQQDATDSVSEASPALSEQNYFDPDQATPGSGGLATITGGAGNPGLSLGYVDSTGTQDPTKPSVSLKLSDITS